MAILYLAQVFTRGFNIPSWVYWTITLVTLFRSYFLAWRDEHRKYKVAIAEVAELKKGGRFEQIFQKVVDEITSGTYPPAALLMANADELDTNEELLKLCDDLVGYGHQPPFKTVAVIEGKLLGKEEYLEFLKEARRRGCKLLGVVETARVREAMLRARQSQPVSAT